MCVCGCVSYMQLNIILQYFCSWFISTAAGSAYREAARVFRRLGNTHDAATALVDAGNLAKEADPQMAIDSFTEASDLFMEIGRFVIAAKHIQTVAELQEARGQQYIDSTIEAYEKAADFFRGENQRRCVYTYVCNYNLLISNLHIRINTCIVLCM